jgi:hypothetical protein
MRESPRSSNDFLEEISPSGVLLLDHRDFPSASPSFNLLFAHYGCPYVWRRFVPNKPVDPVLLRETLDQIISVLNDAPRKIACDSGV